MQSSGDFFGSLVSAAVNLYGMNQAEQQSEKAAEAAQDWRNNRIWYTVQDAKRSGLHPLFALGGGSSTYSPPPQVPFVETARSLGQDLSRASIAALGGLQQQLVEEQIRQVRSQSAVNEAQADAIRMQEARRAQVVQPAMPGAVRPGILVLPEGRTSSAFVGSEFPDGSWREREAGSGGSSGIAGQTVSPGAAARLAPAVTDKPRDMPRLDDIDKTRTAGGRPGWDLVEMFRRPDGTTFRSLVYEKDISESKETQPSLLSMMEIINRNVAEFGMPWITEAYAGPVHEWIMQLSGWNKTGWETLGRWRQALTEKMNELRRRDRVRGGRYAP